MTQMQRHSANNDSELLAEYDKIDLYKKLFEEHAVNKKSYRELGAENNLSPNTVKKYIAVYREMLTTELKAIGKEHLAEIYSKLEWLFTQARTSWEGGNQDVALLTLMRSVVKDQSTLLNVQDVGAGDSDKDPLIMVMDDSAYKEAELKHAAQQQDLSTIEGKFKESDNNTE